MGSKVATIAAVVGAALLAAPPAGAQPEQPPDPAEQPTTAADEHHEQAMKYYSEGEYSAARDSFKAAYEADPNARRLYAWAQAERYAGNCKLAIELYEKALAGDLSDDQKKVVQESRADCERIVAEAERLTAAELDKLETEMKRKPTPPIIRQVVIKQVAPTVPWYKDPVGGALVGTGVVAMGVGAGFYLAARSAESSAKSAEDYGDFEDGFDAANRREKIALISAASGAVVATAGVVWYIIRPNRTRESDKQVSGWVASDGGGVAVSWGF